MKKPLIILSAIMFSFAGMAAIPEHYAPGMAGEKVVCKKVSLGTHKARLVLPDGKKLVISLNDLESYQIGSTVFEKKELFENGKPTGSIAFMQRMKTRDGLTLYKNVVLDPAVSSPNEFRNDFYIYKGDQLYMTVTGKALPNVLNFFGIKWVYA